MDEPTKVKPHTNAPSPPSERGEAKLPPVEHSRDELMHMHAKDLLQILDDRHIDHTGMVEKPELAIQFAQMIKENVAPVKVLAGLFKEILAEQIKAVADQIMEIVVQVKAGLVKGYVPVLLTLKVIDDVL
ncbi:hypothetical protein BGX34_002069 [Mortierella sp. NVP85]|nr:hypothetical protein BGX34_002069 [Mortierella sp. NVP85]